MSSTFEVASSLPSKETVNIAAINAAQDIMQFAANRAAVGTASATESSKAKSPQSTKAFTRTKVLPPSFLTSTHGLDQEIQAATSTVPEKPVKQNYTSQKKVAESVEKQETAIQDDSKMMNVAGRSKTVKRKEQPESSTSACRRQFTRQKREPMFAEEEDDYLTVNMEDVVTSY